MQPPFFCDYGSNILLGERVFFNFNCVVLDVCVVKIGDFTLFGPAVQIYTATHPMNAELRRKQEFAKPIEIGSDVWVGGGAIICPGVKIGSKTVIGAGSVVTRDIPEACSLPAIRAGSSGRSRRRHPEALGAGPTRHSRVAWNVPGPPRFGVPLHMIATLGVDSIILTSFILETS